MPDRILEYVPSSPRTHCAFYTVHPGMLVSCLASLSSLVSLFVESIQIYIQILYITPLEFPDCAEGFLPHFLTLIFLL